MPVRGVFFEFQSQIFVDYFCQLFLYKDKSEIKKTPRKSIVIIPMVILNWFSFNPESSLFLNRSDQMDPSWDSDSDRNYEKRRDDV